MKITALVENTSRCELKPEHGLSLYIETRNHRILFDLGPDETLFSNAKKRNIDLSAVDIVIISHGHADHGGALNEFLRINSNAKVYIQRRAFEPHYAKALFLKIPVGIDKALESHPQIVSIDGDYRIDDELFLFTVSETEKCRSPANNTLYDRNGRDSFSHEQNLIITEGQSVLVMGCGHAGVVNIVGRAEAYRPTVCVGGFHLFNPISGRTAQSGLLDEIIAELRKYGDTRFYTCHCTGMKTYEYMSERMPNLSYLSCGEEIDV